VRATLQSAKDNIRAAFLGIERKTSDWMRRGYLEEESVRLLQGMTDLDHLDLELRRLMRSTARKDRVRSLR
jgi:hypothetical protein